VSFARNIVDDQLISYNTLNASRGTAREANVQSQTLLDYYKCPEGLAQFDLMGELSKEQGYFQFGPGTLCYGRCHGGRPVTHAAGSLFDASQAVEISQGVVRLPFDLSEVVNNLRRERYMADGESSQTLLILKTATRDLYYWLRPWLPVPVRKYLQRISLRGWRRLPFPQWPVDRTVDRILEHALILSMKARGISSVPFIWFWPEGAQSCAMVTHDVETAAGLRSSRMLMDLDDSYGIRTSFQIVPEKRYAVSRELLEEFRSRGFEIVVQDLNHDGNLFRDRAEFLRRASRINEHLRQFGAKGFRSAIMYRNADWLEAIAARYDMSFPSVAHLEPQRGGCCTIIPYFIGGILELPLTTTQDYSLLHILSESSMDLWKQQIQLIREKNGLISFIIHPDYLRGETEIGLYRALLRHLCTLREEGALWIARPGEINQWWRARDQMKLACHSGKWRIEGEDSARARVAYATLADDRITYAFEAND